MTTIAKTDCEKCKTGKCKAILTPVHDALDVIGGKWRMHVIISIRMGNERFTDIQHSIRGITPKMLSKELKELEMHKLIIREIENCYPVKIRYKLDPYTESLVPIILSLRDWGVAHKQRLFPSDKNKTEED